ncbi:class I SAM-dependent methyltransferase [Spirosoma daeguense]
MNDTWTDRWNARYRSDEYAYGLQPNDYLKEKLQTLSVGKILFPAEGEGRNAVYAAKIGWNVSAFDISVEGQKKARQLADNNHVTLDYQVGELQTLPYVTDQFDAVALIYAHFPADIKSTYHRQLGQYVRSGGFIIFEAFSKKHLSYVLQDERIGGPRDIESLFSIDELTADFASFTFLELQEMEIELHEGLYHNGRGSVIRMLAQKK